MAMEEDEGRGYCYAGRESTLKHILCGGNFLTRPPTADTFHPHYPPPDYPSLRASSNHRYSISSLRADEIVSHCACPTKHK